MGNVTPGAAASNTPLTHYARVLGGRITAAFPYGEGPMSKHVPEKMKDWLMHCWLEVGDQALMGADMDVQWAPNIEKPKNGFDVTLRTGDVEEAKRWYQALAEGGREVMPFEATFWSPGYGRWWTSSGCRGW